MKFRIRVLILVAVTVIVICTYLTVIRPDFSDRSESIDDNDYIDIPDARVDAWDLGPDPKWVKALRASYNSSKSVISQNDRPRSRRLSVPDRVNKYINMYQPKWDYLLNATSPWSIASNWVTSRQLVGVEATELGTNSVDAVILLAINFCKLMSGPETQSTGSKECICMQKQSVTVVICSRHAYYFL